MFHRRIRNARLRSSSSESRSRSTTPSGNRSAERQSHARRGLLMGLLSEAPRNIESSPPRKVRAMAVESTPGGSLTVSHELVLNQTPGGTIRRAAETASVNVAERVEAMDLSDSEIEDLLETNRDHLLRWIPELAAIPSTSGSSSNSLTAAMLPPPLPSQIPSASPSSSGATVIRIVDYDSDGSGLDSVYDDEFDRIGATTTTRDIPDDVTLDASDRVIINDVARSMDDEADRLLGTSPNFTWSEDFQSFRGVPEPFTGPTPGPVNDYSTIYDAFVDIWDKDIINHIVCETNRYAELTIERLRAKGTFRRSSRVYRWEPTNADEIMVFFAVMQYMAIDTRTSLSEYWSKGVLGMPLFRGLLSYNRYILLNKFLHFVDNSDTHRTMPLDGVMGSARELSPRLSKLAPIISHLGKKFDSLYRLKPHISIDESLTLFKGRLSWVQTIRSKSARFGIKSYELCESETGYMARFQIYTGKDDVLSDAQISADLGLKSARTVLELLRGLERRGHCVTMDNFYNCPSLARYLKSQGFDCLGTLRPNRRYVPNEIAKVPANVQKGTIVARHSGDVSIVAWKDSKVVNIISTFHNADTYVGSRAGKSVVKPVCIRDYNKYMGGIDLKDQKLSMYFLERKRGVKWYVKLFKRLLNVSILNSMIMNAACLVRRGQPSMTHREYRYSLAELIIEKHRSSRVIERPVSGLMRLRRDVLHEPAHHPGANNKRRCRVCYAKTKTKKSSNYRCVPCDVFLCFGDCWREWHSLEQLQPQEERSRRRQRE